ncbi:MAG: 16S rRNA (uracil(1498)-N(3))-methyltransferase [Syntrophorhabdales bacterium]|jgi:16S rRNA (uracil1498-N3)-methyltransferase
METDKRVPVRLLSDARTGAIVTVSDEESREYRGRVVRLEGEEALIRIFQELDFPSESPLEITLLQAIPKRERMELIIQKATELGVREIIPCTSARSVTPGGIGSGQDKSHRWPAIAGRAVAQCRRRLVPLVAPCRDFSDGIDGLSDREGVKLLLYEKERSVCLGDLGKGLLRETPLRVVIACGPEGGFTDGEIVFARERGFVPVRLGGRTLRCETAALTAIAIIQYIWGDL